MTCSECGQILGAGLVKCTNCGTPVNATLQYREVDAPVTVPAAPTAVVDLTELDVVDLRELVHQLVDEAPAEDADELATMAASRTEAFRAAWDVQRKNAFLLFPPRSDGRRPTIDDITPAR